MKLYFYHLDHLGTPRVITDIAGQLVSKHKYLPYGEELSPPPSLNTHKFTGHERDKETGLDYMLARYYSSGATLRFLSADPVTVKPGRFLLPQRLNLYAYAANNPAKYIDPTGEDVAVGARPVRLAPGDAMHTFIILTPTGANVQKYANRVSKDGKIYLSGFPSDDGETLVKKQNDRKDRGKADKTIPVVPPAGTSVEKFETDVIEAYDLYKDNLPYDYVPYYSGTGYNSNSLTSGILNAAGAQATKPTESQIGNAPGWNQAVPLGNTTAKYSCSICTDLAVDPAHEILAQGEQDAAAAKADSQATQGYRGDLSMKSCVGQCK